MVSPALAVHSPVADRVVTSLRHSPYRQLRRVHAHEDRGAIVLRGRLPTFFLKQVAQVLAAQVDGVGQIVNETVVDQP